MADRTYWLVVSDLLDATAVHDRLANAPDDAEVILLDSDRRPRMIVAVADLRVVMPQLAERVAESRVADDELRFRDDATVADDEPVGVASIESDLHIVAGTRAFGIVRGAITLEAVREALAVTLDIPGTDPDEDAKVRYLCVPTGNYYWLPPNQDGQPCPDGDNGTLIPR